LGYLQDFLFTPDRSRQLAKFLSGGERNRLLLARLFKTPSNVLVLDEPTNDLDAETLELLEELVSNYEGTLLLVSHDRAFLNNVVTSIIAVDGSGDVKEYGGGYDDYQRARQASQKAAQKAEAAARSQARSAATESSRSAGAGTLSSRVEVVKAANKLTFKERQELELLPAKIESLERQQSSLHQQMVDPGFFKQSPDKIVLVNQQLAEIESELARLFERWESLEGRQ
jgi:ATP-binding cassette subfamily F protein uup